MTVLVLWTLACWRRDERSKKMRLLNPVGVAEFGKAPDRSLFAAGGVGDAAFEEAMLKFSGEHMNDAGVGTVARVRWRVGTKVVSSFETSSENLNITRLHLFRN